MSASSEGVLLVGADLIFARSPSTCLVRSARSSSWILIPGGGTGRTLSGMLSAGPSAKIETAASTGMRGGGIKGGGWRIGGGGAISLRRNGNHEIARMCTDRVRGKNCLELGGGT